MLRKALSLSSVIVLSLVGATSAGEDSQSADAIMRGCRMNPREASNVTPLEAWERGHCSRLGYDPWFFVIARCHQVRIQLV